MVIFASPYRCGQDTLQTLHLGNSRSCCCCDFEVTPSGRGGESLAVPAWVRLTWEFVLE